MKAFIRITGQAERFPGSLAGGQTPADRLLKAVEAAADSVRVLENDRIAPRFEGRAVFVDPRFRALGAHTVRAAIRTAEKGNAPLQSVRLPETPPAWTTENIARVVSRTGIRSNRWDCEFEEDTAGPLEIRWLVVSALSGKKVLAFGCKEYTIPPEIAFCGSSPHPRVIVKPEWGAAEIPLSIAVSEAGRKWRIEAQWPAVKDADCYNATIYRTTIEDGDQGKSYSIPGIMHIDPCRGSLVRPADGVKLCNRQALPPLYQRCNAIVIGTDDEARRLIRGEYPAGALAFALPRDESLCINGEIDVIRYELLLEKNSEPAAAEAQTR